MTSEALRRWLDARDPPPPAELRALLDDDLDMTALLPERLTEAALRRLRMALQRPGERSAAFELLAADAHFTYACEAVVVEASLDPPAGDGEGATGDRLRRVLRRVADPPA